jgi:asparagine synthase (glutamine-hydrolysing)
VAPSRCLQTPAGHGPPRPAGLADRQAEQGHFTPLLYAGLRAHHQELHELIDASTLVGHGLIDATAVHTALDVAAAGIGRPPLPALENFLITSWPLSHTMALAPTGGAR